MAASDDLNHRADEAREEFSKLTPDEKKTLLQDRIVAESVDDDSDIVGYVF